MRGTADEDRLDQGAGAGEPEPTIIAESASMRQAVQLARRFATTDLPVLLVGETGTGKEVLAQAIHRWSGRKGDLVDVDCGALPPGMAVAELFGHRKGAYTSAVESVPGLIEGAHGGTLFLDELASLPPDGQGALLRVLETGIVRRVGDGTRIRVSIRLVAAIQDTPGVASGHHQLRSELYHRLAGTVIALPPLRRRPQDLYPLASHLAGIHGRSLSPKAREILQLYHWPGNVRELRHVVARAVILSDALELDAQTLSEALSVSSGVDLLRSGSQTVRQERSALLTAYQDCQGETDAMARALGISRATLYRRLQQAGLQMQEMRQSEILNSPSHRLTSSETVSETA